MKSRILKKRETLYSLLIIDQIELLQHAYLMALSFKTLL